jgi:diacylglycerol kinase (ATP)
VHRRGLDELGQHAARRRRVQEGDSGAADAGTRRVVDQAHPGRAEIGERRRDVVDPVRDVVQPGATAGEEASDRRIGAERRKQLDVALPDVEERGLHALVGERLAMNERHPVGVAVDRDRGVEVLDRDAHVIDAAEHAAESTLSAVRIALIANRTSGGTLEPEPLAEAMRDRGASVEVYGHRPDELERAAAGAAERVAVAGGDGTIGPVADLARRLGVPLAVIPTGTANDFARAADLPADPLEAAALAATGGATRPMELGRLADARPFVNVASAGLASVAARQAQPLKPRLGPLAYGIGAARAAATEHPLPLAVRVDGHEAFSGACWQAIVAVTGAFGAGSGVGDTDPHDGELDVVVLPAGSRAGLARRAWGLRTRTIRQQRGVVHDRGLVVEIALPDGSEINVDGELRRGGLERVTAQASAFRLVVPDE